MDHAEFVKKTNEIAAQMSPDTDKETKENAMREFFAVGIDMWNEHIAGEITFADGRTATMNKIEN